MEIEVASIVPHVEQTIFISGDLKISRIDSLKKQRISIELPVSVMKTGKSIHVNGKLKGSFTLPCDLCLEPVNISMEMDYNEYFVSDSAQCNDEVWFYEGSQIDLAPSIESTLLLHMPMKVLCKGQCKGFCCICGNDLNKNACECNTDRFDPRFEVLRTMFPDREV